MIKRLRAIWNLARSVEAWEGRHRLICEHVKDCIIRLSTVEGKSENGTVKSRLDDLTVRVEGLENTIRVLNEKYDEDLEKGEG